MDSAIEMIEKYATDAVRAGSGGRRDPRPRDPGLQRDPEPGRPRHGARAERQRVRPQPRLHDAVAAGDDRLRSTLMKRWLAPEMLDLHGYVDADADRGDDQAAQPEHRVRPVAEVEPAAHRLPTRRRSTRSAATSSGRSTTGAPRPIRTRTARATTARPPGPDVAEGWDDWGPFYAPMYHQHIGLDSSTVEMCIETATGRPTRGTGPAAAARRPRDPERRAGVDVRVRGREPRGDAPRRARDVPPR